MLSVFHVFLSRINPFLPSQVSTFYPLAPQANLSQSSKNRLSKVKYSRKSKTSTALHHLEIGLGLKNMFPCLFDISMSCQHEKHQSIDSLQSASKCVTGEQRAKWQNASQGSKGLKSWVRLIREIASDPVHSADCSGPLSRHLFRSQLSRNFEKVRGRQNGGSRRFVENHHKCAQNFPKTTWHSTKTDKIHR